MPPPERCSFSMCPFKYGSFYLNSIEFLLDQKHLKNLYYLRKYIFPAYWANNLR